MSASNPLGIVFGGISTTVLQWALLGVAVIAGIQTLRLAEAHADYATLEASVETGRANRSEAARADEVKTATRERQHAADTQGATDVFTQGQPARAADAGADAARFKRLLDGATARAASYRAQAQAGAAACSALADRQAALDRHIVEGVGVVADLRAALARRDAEVALMGGLLDADDKLLAQE